MTDVVYLDLDGHEYLVDVYVPAGEGPWPVGVAVHGEFLDKEDATNVLVARAAAEAGTVVFVPDWDGESPSDVDKDVGSIRSIQPVYRCAMAFAQQQATGYGRDPNRTVTWGFSAGVGPAASFALNPTTDLTPGCLARTPPIRHVGAVLGDGQYFFHPAVWDAAFDADPEGMQAITDEVLHPASGPADLSTRFRLWAADPGTIRQDLDGLAQLDEGIIAMTDEGLLLATRLQHAGVDATIDFLPGPHHTIDKVPELVAYLLDAAGTG